MESYFESIICLCTSLTCWRGWSCFEKYVTKPQTINLDIVESTPLRIPNVSFCIVNPFNATVLDQCGIQNYTSQWTSGLCPDAKQVRKMVLKPSDIYLSNYSDKIPTNCYLCVLKSAGILGYYWESHCWIVSQSGHNSTSNKNPFDQIFSMHFCQQKNIKIPMV